MGNTSVKVSQDLYSHIKQTVTDLVYKYKFWTDEGICDKLSVVYYDKLIQFQKLDLLDASAAIGIKYDQADNVEKGKLCSNIINHFQKRINLLEEIWEAVDKGYRRVNHAKSGPICRNVDAYVEDFFTCKKYNGLWLNQEQYADIINRLKELNIHDNWLKHISDLDRKWQKYMKILLKSIDIIKEDINNSMDDETFTELEVATRAIIKKMNYICDIHYLLVTNYG